MVRLSLPSELGKTGRGGGKKDGPNFFFFSAADKYFNNNSIWHQETRRDGRAREEKIFKIEREKICIFLLRMYCT